MDNSKSRTTVILSEKDILRKCHYDITCKVNSTGITLSHPWGSPIHISDEIQCFSKVKNSLGKFLLKRICEDNQYPYEFTFLEAPKDDSNLEYLSDDIIQNGLRPQHLTLAEESKIKDEFLIISDFYMNINKYVGTTKLRSVNKK